MVKRKEIAPYVQKVFSAMTPSFNSTPKENIQHQAQTTYNWKGACDRLSNISKPTLVIVGTDDIVRPPANSLMLAEKNSRSMACTDKRRRSWSYVSISTTIYCSFRNFLSIT